MSSLPGSLQTVSELEYVFFCDESDRKGTFFSHFYGGLRVPASQLNAINATLEAKKQSLGITSEVKWEKTDRLNVERYELMMETFFQEVATRGMAVRIMFTQNIHVPQGLTPQHVEDSYYILYYQFLKHAFGLRHLPPHSEPPRIRIYLDEMGDTREKISQFRGYVAGLAQDAQIRKHRLILKPEDITEIRSHDHILMQCLDVVLGSISFRLNNKHTLIPSGARVRGKRTLAKDRLRKHILTLIKRVSGKAHFNIGISTGTTSTAARLSDPYLHWRFTPRNHALDLSKAKP